MSIQKNFAKLVPDMSTGPTSLLGLLTAEIVRDYTSEGFSAQAIASMVAMCVGIYCLIIGGLKLGFLLEFVSIPVLHGFISAAGIVIMLGQIPSLFGVKVGTGTGTIIHDIFAQVPVGQQHLKTPELFSQYIGLQRAHGRCRSRRNCTFGCLAEDGPALGR